MNQTPKIPGGLALSHALALADLGRLKALPRTRPDQTSTNSLSAFCFHCSPPFPVRPSPVRPLHCAPLQKRTQRPHPEPSTHTSTQKTHKSESAQSKQRERHQIRSGRAAKARYSCQAQPHCARALLRPAAARKVREPASFSIPSPLLSLSSFSLPGALSPGPGRRLRPRARDRPPRRGELAHVTRGRPPCRRPLAEDTGSRAAAASTTSTSTSTSCCSARPRRGSSTTCRSTAGARSCGSRQITPPRTLHPPLRRAPPHGRRRRPSTPTRLLPPPTRRTARPPWRRPRPS